MKKRSLRGLEKRERLIRRLQKRGIKRESDAIVLCERLILEKQRGKKINQFTDLEVRRIIRDYRAMPLEFYHKNSKTLRNYGDLAKYLHDYGNWSEFLLEIETKNNYEDFFGEIETPKKREPIKMQGYLNTIVAELETIAQLTKVKSAYN